MMMWKPHVTVAAIAEVDEKFLIVEEIVDGERVFNQPAGHLDSGETLIEAVIREAWEETGCTFLPEALVGVQLWRHPVHSESFLRFAFCGICTGRMAPDPPDHSIEAVHWMTRDELARDGVRLRSPLVLRSIDDYLEGRRYGLDILEHLISDSEY